MFAKKPPAPAVIPKESEEIKREWAIKAMERKLPRKPESYPSQSDTASSSTFLLAPASQKGT